jgi:hypothetical protein
MGESIRIEAQERRAVYLDHFDGDIWMSLQTTGGNAYCVIGKEEAYKMLKALHELLGQAEEA